MRATAATGMMAQELNVQVISNNIANMRTTGYKRQRAEFQDLLYEQVRRVGTQTSEQGNLLGLWQRYVPWEPFLHVNYFTEERESSLF
jgi:flagellar basal body rod protein FlgG